MRKVKFVTEKYYHIYNRGVDRRDIFLDEGDYGRFLRSMVEFNRQDPIGSLAELEFPKKIETCTSESNSLTKVLNCEDGVDIRKGIGSLTTSAPERIVDFVAYCLNLNHFHFILRQTADDGISKFMHKLSLGYTCYFNIKYKRSGSLFQGKFKSVQIDSEEHLLWVAAYVNGNAQIHSLIPDAADYQWCGYSEYLGKSDSNICDKSIILENFKDIDKFTEASEQCFRQMKKRKDLQKYILD